MKDLPAVRERTEDLERASLSTWATLAAESKGRDNAEEPDPLRTAFQADRDRITESVAFRRLKHKTHLHLGDGHRRTRATHALEVAQIGRTIGRSLRLNEDLIEAIALGHDIGNTAFGDAGEEALSMVLAVPFRHEEHSLRVVEVLENDGAGLNLTWEVRDGIVTHPADTPSPATLEGQTVRVADAIATATQDVRDAHRAGLLSDDDIPASVTAALGETDQARLAVLIRDVVTQSMDQPELAMSPRVEEAQHSLIDVLRAALAGSPSVCEERDRAIHCLSSLAVFLLRNPDHADAEQQTAARTIDAVAALTDREALAEYRRRLLPGD